MAEAHGGISNAATGFDDVHYHLPMPKEALLLACELLPQLVLKPEIRSDDFVLERQVVLEELAQSEDQPEEQAFQQLLAGLRRARLWQANPGQPQAIAAANAEQMQAFQRRHYCAESCAVSLSGGFELGQFKTCSKRARWLSCQAAQGPSPIDLLSESVLPAFARAARLESARLLMPAGATSP